MHDSLLRDVDFWSFLLSVDQDSANCARKMDAPVEATCTPPTIVGSPGADPTVFPGSAASG